jgi:purine-cytosine permease-like protein
MTFGTAVTIVIVSFADSGTMTADFTRWAKNGQSAVYAAFTAFPVANWPPNSLAQSLSAPTRPHLQPRAAAISSRC